MTAVAVAAVAAERRKATTLPGVLVGLAVMVLGPMAIVGVNLGYTRSALQEGSTDPSLGDVIDLAMVGAPIGTVGAVVIGVLVAASEYTRARAEVGGGAQITTTLLAVSGRTTTLAAKIAVTIALVGIAGVVSVAAGVAVASAGLGDLATVPATLEALLPRLGGALLFWSMSALMALAIGLLARNALIPLILLVGNSSVVSVSMLLSMATDVAFYLPDVAGIRLLGSANVVDGALEPTLGGFVMAGWTAAALVAAAVVLKRRDA